MTSDAIRRAHGCYPDAVGNYPCDNGAVCDACMLVTEPQKETNATYFSASEHYKGKQCTNVYLPNYSEGLALHKLLVQANLTFEESSDEEWINEDRYHHFTITVDGKTVDFLLGAPQYEALIAFIEHIAAENMHYVDPKLKYVEGVL